MWLLGAVLLAGCGVAEIDSPSFAASEAPAASVTRALAAHTEDPAAADEPSGELSGELSGEPTVQPTAEEAARPDSSATGELVRVVGVVDGDTLRVSVGGVTERLRIIGIDAPELRYDECYAQAGASRMQSLVQSRDVRIVADPTQADRDVYDRLLRHVFTQDGVSAGHTMVLEGLAREYTYDKPYASRDAYLAAQEVARAGKLGIWSGACDLALATPSVTTAPPAAAAPFAPAPAAPAEGERCAIKGNINSKGEHIYHVPGGRSYDDTLINEGKGERWFCTEQEAVDAGWRRAKR